MNLFILIAIFIDKVKLSYFACFGANEEHFFSTVFVVVAAALLLVSFFR